MLQSLNYKVIRLFMIVRQSLIFYIIDNINFQFQIIFKRLYYFNSFYIFKLEVLHILVLLV